MIRNRRLRMNQNIRKLVQDVHLSKDDLIQPLFVSEDIEEKEEIASMPGLYHHTIESLVQEVRELLALDMHYILLFGVPKSKDDLGSEAYNKEGIVQRAVKRLKEEFGDEVYIITDVCLCAYTSHGHCGFILDNKVDNDRTCQLLEKVALSHVQAGADMVAPSDMMDFRVGKIRNVLDDNGFTDVPIMSYSVKYASSYYGPFREAAHSAPSFGDRRSYQMDPNFSVDFIDQANSDLEEGADILMVKPAMAYLDVLYQLKQMATRPVAAYQVSGEYVMLKTGIEQGLFDKKIIEESLCSIKRAGADIIITYFAKEVVSSGIAR